MDTYKPQPFYTRHLTLVPDIKPQATVLEIWNKYVESAHTASKAKTLQSLAEFTKRFEKIGDVSILDALLVKGELAKGTVGQGTTPGMIKRCLMQLNSACKFAVKHGLIDGNPYEGMAKEMGQFNYQLNPKPNAFTEAERDDVIEAFKNHSGNWNGRGKCGFSYSHYASFVEFMFLTGCRPSEAIGLTWRQVSPDFSSVLFDGSTVTTSDGKQHRNKGSKNNKTRTFFCSASLRALLEAIKPTNAAPDDLVFPSPTGKAINYGNFSNKAWNVIVNPIKPDTTPYCCRDTFITTQIIKGSRVMAIAKWCDTSVEMIEKHYADSQKIASIRPLD